MSILTKPYEVIKSMWSTGIEWGKSTIQDVAKTWSDAVSSTFQWVVPVTKKYLTDIVAPIPKRFKETARDKTISDLTFFDSKKIGKTIATKLTAPIMTIPRMMRAWAQATYDWTKAAVTAAPKYVYNSTLEVGKWAIWLGVAGAKGVVGVTKTLADMAWAWLDTINPTWWSSPKPESKK